MATASKKVSRRLRIRRGIRKKINGTVHRPRLSVFKSNKSIYAQLIDDINGKTLFAVSSKEFSSSNATVDVAAQVGKKIAEKATEGGVSTAVFDRGGYIYHGQVKALADGAREGGLKF